MCLFYASWYVNGQRLTDAMQFCLPIMLLSVLMAIRHYMWLVMPLSQIPEQQHWHLHEPQSAEVQSPDVQLLGQPNNYSLLRPQQRDLAAPLAVCWWQQPVGSVRLPLFFSRISILLHLLSCCHDWQLLKMFCDKRLWKSQKSYIIFKKKRRCS